MVVTWIKWMQKMKTISYIVVQQKWKHKINEAYYCNVMLLQQFLPAIRQISSKFFVYQQESASALTAALRQSDFFPVTSPGIGRF